MFKREREKGGKRESDISPYRHLLYMFPAVFEREWSGDSAQGSWRSAAIERAPHTGEQTDSATPRNRYISNHNQPD